MPTPRAHGGAALVQLPITLPAFKGLNTAQSGAILGPEWATRLENTIIDRNGRIAAREGWHLHTTSSHTSDFISGIQYRKADGTRAFVLTTATEVITSTDTGQTFSDVTGTASFTDGNWHLVNFNDYIIGFQQDEEHLVYNGTAASQTSGSPTGAAGTAAFGRIWASNSDNTELHYSALLDHTDFSGMDTGSFDLTNIFPSFDTIVAIRQHNNFLVVFGSENILIYDDGTGSDVGIDPTQMTLRDSIAGIGCFSQLSIQDVDGDLWFISNNYELTSLKRVVLEQQGGALVKLSQNVSDRLRDRIDSGSFQVARLRTLYSPRDRFYLLSLPTESSSGAGDEIGSVFAFDTRQMLEDGSARCMGIWNQLVPTVFLYDDFNNNWVSALHTETGDLGHYHLGNDGDNTFTTIYESGWLDLTGEGYLLILKRITALFYGDLQTTVNLKWAWDFETTFSIRTVTLTSTGSASEWGVGEWGVGEWGGGISLKNKKVAGAGTGEFIKVGCEATIDGGSFAIQNLHMFTKIGRLV